MKKYKFVVVGGGTSGAIASTYIKKYWGDLVEVVVIYDHSQPNIGVGESLTESIHVYLRYVGIHFEELIKYANSTIKLGIKFENWLNDGSYFYHPFNSTSVKTPYNYEPAFDLVKGQYDNDTTYGSIMFEENRIPVPDLSISNFSLHIDGNIFSKFILNKFKDELSIIDDTVIDVIKKNNLEEIDYIVCKKSGKITGDFFIDASGFDAKIFGKLKNKWIDKKEWLPLNRFIPNPLKVKHKILPVCTTAESTDQGWILQVPLQHRWGTGYLFSSDFISNESALSKFDQFLNKKFQTSLENDKVLSFSSGYWQKLWVGNCLSVGLSSGFIEPLEATNIHQCIYQIMEFVNKFNFKIFNFDIDQYNQDYCNFYERAYLFIRFCYSTKRKDSEFWKYMTNNVPYEVRCLDEKIEKDFLNVGSMPPGMFNYNNFFKIAVGLKKVDIKSYEKILVDRKVIDLVGSRCDYIREVKNHVYNNSLDHLSYINLIKNQ